jgi:hypothetical protein
MHRWRLCCQIMPEAEGYKHPWTFDCTKVLSLSLSHMCGCVNTHMYASEYGTLREGRCGSTRTIR